MSRGVGNVHGSVESQFQDNLTEAQQSHIRLVRGRGGIPLVERTFPAPHHLDGGLPPLDHPTAVRHMFAAQKHFDLLRNPGGPNLDVPGTKFNSMLRPEGDVVIRGVHRFVEALPFGDYWNWPAYGDRAPHQPQALQLAGSLVKYFVEVADNEMDECLGDIAGVHQWGVTPGNRAVLLDNDPIVHDLEPDKRRYVVGDYLRTVQAWARLIQPAETGDEMMGMIEEVIQSNHFGV